MLAAIRDTGTSGLGSGLMQAAAIPQFLKIREINPSSSLEIELVAARMQLTLIEVLGQEIGAVMYSMDWLIKRVEWHLDPEMCTGQVFLGAVEEGQIAGHTIVRLDVDFEGRPIGLFSTTYVAPEFRGVGVARNLIVTGESWMLGRGMVKSVTYTARGNTPLLKLFESQGYAVSEIRGEFAVLSKRLS